MNAKINHLDASKLVSGQSIEPEKIQFTDDEIPSQKVYGASIKAVVEEDREDEEDEQ